MQQVPISAAWVDGDCKRPRGAVHDHAPVDAGQALIVPCHGIDQSGVLQRAQVHLKPTRSMPVALDRESNKGKGATRVKESDATEANLDYDAALYRVSSS